ncbi:MAG: DUF4405 domain-containing protein [Gammaproteobacteria bacterium]
MKQTHVNFIIDALAFIAFVFLTSTGVLLHYLLPPGSGHNTLLWGLDRHQWGFLHFWISVVFFSLLALHLFLHWRWLINLVKGREVEGAWLRVGLGIVGISALLGFAAAPLIAPVEISATGKNSLIPSSHPDENVDIRGSMTLREVAEATGVPAEYILEKLDLPPSLAKSEKLGKLKRIYGFEIAAVRKAVADYNKK